jgi:hypothetical protein
MATARPTAERLLEAFKGIPFIVEKREDVRVGHRVEKSSPLQERILSLLHLPKEIDDLSFITARVGHDYDPSEDPLGLAMA